MRIRNCRDGEAVRVLVVPRVFSSVWMVAARPCLVGLMCIFCSKLSLWERGDGISYWGMSGAGFCLDIRGRASARPFLDAGVACHLSGFAWLLVLAFPYDVIPSTRSMASSFMRGSSVASYCLSSV